jgi:hypothetical protein
MEIIVYITLSTSCDKPCRQHCLTIQHSGLLHKPRPPSSARARLLHTRGWATPWCSSSWWHNHYSISTTNDNYCMNASFWSSSWLHGQMSQSIPLEIFKISKCKKACVHNALNNSRWNADISMENFTVENISQFLNSGVFFRGQSNP